MNNFSIFIDTSLPNFYMLLIDENFKIIDKIFIEQLKKKADFLPEAFQKIISNNKIKTTDISDFYVTNGPGSFMGARTSIMFVIPFHLSSKSRVHVGTSFYVVSALNNGTYAIDAKSSQSYIAEVSDGDISTKLDGHVNDSEIQYDSFEDNLKNILDKFKLISNYELINADYIKEPKVGG